MFMMGFWHAYEQLPRVASFLFSSTNLQVTFVFKSLFLVLLVVITPRFALPSLHHDTR